MTQTPDYQYLRLETAGGIARLTLARPDALNALSRPLLAEIMSALDVVRDGGEARVLVITGEGRGFSSGADISGGGGGTAAGTPGFDAGDVLDQYYNPIIERMFDLPIPIVSGVHGPVAGAGCMIALAADVTIAARSAFFLQAFANIGLVPDAGSMWLLPRLVGRARAMAMMLLAERIPAETAQEWGLVYEVVDDDALAGRIDAIAEKLANGPTRAYALIRRGVRQALDGTLSETLVYERRAQLEAGRSPDFAEGVAAFREKRRPQFTGR